MASRGTKIAIVIPLALLTMACIVAAGVYLYDAMSREECASSTHNQFRVISLALLNYQDVFSCLPPPDVRNEDGKLICSWRQVVIPLMLESSGPSFSSDSPNFWDPWSSTRWDDAEFARENELSTWGRLDFVCHRDCACYGTEETQVMAITGPNTAFEQFQGFLPTVGASQLQARGIPVDAILIAEVHASGINWRQPGDLDIRTMANEINSKIGTGISGGSSDRFHVIFVDGQVWELSSKVPFETLKRFLTIDSAKEHERESELGPYRLR